jgi:hypothetical protein
MFCIDCCDEIMDLIYNMIHSTSFEKQEAIKQESVNVCLYFSLFRLVFSIIWLPTLVAFPSFLFWANKLKLCETAWSLNRSGLAFQLLFFISLKLLIKIYVYGFNSSFIALYVYKRKGVNATWLDTNRDCSLMGLYASFKFPSIGFCLIMQLLSSCWGWFTMYKKRNFSKKKKGVRSAS